MAGQAGGEAGQTGGRVAGQAGGGAGQAGGVVAAPSST